MSSIGIQLPIVYNSHDGFKMIKTVRTMLRQNLKMLLLTIPGERVMEPNFGVGVATYLFQNYSENVTAEIKRKITQQVDLYIPALRLQSINFQNNPDFNSMRIIIQYQIPDIGINDLLDITI
tara:strand:+ start:233 stop:598 length:366 start_codon:yes stop_codon:yes gene_type:complete